MTFRMFVNLSQDLGTLYSHQLTQVLPQVCRACGITERPNSCNANLYEALAMLEVYVFNQTETIKACASRMKRIQLVGMQMMSRQPICRAWGNCMKL